MVFPIFPRDPMRPVRGSYQPTPPEVAYQIIPSSSSVTAMAARLVSLSGVLSVISRKL